MAAFPASPSELTADWLSGVLGAPVAGLSHENLGEGVGVMAEVSRIHVEYDDEAEGPETLILKTVAPMPQNRETATQYGFYRREVRFYQDVADKLRIRVPRCYYAGMDESSVPFAILMEEVTGARVIDQLDGGSMADAEMVVDAIAALHARWWDSPELDQLDWLPPVNNDLYKGYAAVMPQLVPVLEAKYGDRIEPEGFALLAAMGDHYPDYLDHWIESGPVTFAHYDLRLDNILFEPPSDPGSICLLDWQLAVRHRGTFDLAYYLGQNVPPDFRRDHQEAIVRRYHDALTGRGISGYSYDQCWDDYRRGMLMHIVSATQIAILEGGNERGQQLLDAMLTAGWTAAVELDAGEFLPR